MHRPRGTALLKGRFAVELFAGTARLSDALAKEGFAAQSWEIARGPGNDFMVKKLRKKLEEEIEQGKVFFVWAGLPCGTWSRARRSDGKGPSAVRSNNQVYGFEDLSGANLLTVRLANAMLKEIFALLKLCVKMRVPFVLENPGSSRLWLTSEVEAPNKLGAKLDLFDFCQYKEPWRKRTGLLSFGVNKFCDELKMCRPIEHRCSATNKRHLVLEGRDGQGVFWTRRAQAYPLQFCKEAAEHMRRDFLALPPRPGSLTRSVLRDLGGKGATANRD